MIYAIYKGDYDNMNIKKVFYIFLITAFLVIGGFTSIYAQETGNASWYGEAFHGKKTASGEIFNMYGYTAAHKTYEFGTKIKVTNLANDKSVIVTVNDRGPYVGDRIVDLSKKAFSEIAELDEGIIQVKVEKVSDKDTTKDTTTKTESKNDTTVKDDTNTSYQQEDIEGEVLTKQDKESSSEKYYFRLQFGAFSKRENAIEYAKVLIKAGIKVKVYKVKYKDSEKILYKVISDERFDTLELAKKSEKKYKDMKVDCFIIKINF